MVFRFVCRAIFQERNTPVILILRSPLRLYLSVRLSGGKFKQPACVYACMPLKLHGVVFVAWLVRLNKSNTLRAELEKLRA